MLELKFNLKLTKLMKLIKLIFVVYFDKKKI